MTLSARTYTYILNKNQCLALSTNLNFYLQNDNDILVNYTDLVTKIVGLLL